MRLGRHAMLDGSGVDPEVLNNRQYIEQWLRVACEAAGATVLETISHKFEPQGVTVVCLLAESHASIHTYPEHGRYMADVFTCGDLDPELAINVLRRQLGGTGYVQVVERPITQTGGSNDSSSKEEIESKAPPFDRYIPPAPG